MLELGSGVKTRLRQLRVVICKEGFLPSRGGDYGEAELRM
jgi:hypothetical protein